MRCRWSLGWIAKPFYTSLSSAGKETMSYMFIAFAVLEDRSFAVWLYVFHHYSCTSKRPEEGTEPHLRLSPTARAYSSATICYGEMNQLRCEGLWLEPGLLQPCLPGFPAAQVHMRCIWHWWGSASPSPGAAVCITDSSVNDATDDMMLRKKIA